ncbi:MAG: 3'-5' exonuclease [Lachnospiraceae bacterium]|nr:3'-5' exonuclease [Lachnospiraceae bacterium]
MNYIVFDLEWNQCPYGKDFENPRLPFEIIEIGAVKLNEKKEYVDSFRALIRPAVYRRLHFQTKKVIGLSEAELRHGKPFREAAKEFIEWCGEDPRFCTWGTLDLMELQRNLIYYRMGSLLPGPIIYEDVQKLFAIAYETRKERRALKFAVSFLGLPEDGGFHLAKEDAAYTARVLQQIPDSIIASEYSIDCFCNPKSRDDEIRLRYSGYEKFISREFDTKEELLAAEDVCAVRCFTCGKNVRRQIRWFSDGSGRNHLAVGKCEEHGFVKCKLRVREAYDGKYYAIRTTKHIGEKELQDIRDRQAFVKIRKQNRRKK